MPEMNAHIQDPKYFEQAVSDYSDVVPTTFTKSAPGYRTQIFCRTRISAGKKEKKALTKL